jgi:hypothetical protein
VSYDVISTSSACFFEASSEYSYLLSLKDPSITHRTSSTMNPYATEPEHIPSTDLYADIPLYGRYRPKPRDFHVNPEHVGSQSAESMQYWASVVGFCDESIRVYPADNGGRDVFALGNIIVKSSHLHDTQETDYSFADANEARAIDIAKNVLKDIRVPEIYFAGKVFPHSLLYSST